MLRSALCKTCLDKWFKEESLKSCPYCRSNAFTHIIDKSKQREINELQVECPNKEYGCEEKLTRGDLKKHMTKCTHVTIECTNTCEDIMFRKDLNEHLKEHCQSRKINCQHCGTKGKHSAITSPLHLHTCTHLPVECSNNCQQEGVMRKDLQNHLDKECVKRQVYCEYCGERGTFQYYNWHTFRGVPGCPNKLPQGMSIRRHHKKYARRSQTSL